MPDETKGDSMWAAVGKYGVGTVLALILIGILRWDMILPANQERSTTIQALIESSANSAKINTSLTESYQKLTTSLEGQTSILKQIRDDQRGGVWRAAPIPEPRPE